jgi:hypothetical protein
LMIFANIVVDYVLKYVVKIQKNAISTDNYFYTNL